MRGIQANRGKALEELINMANRQYRSKKLAVVHKVPTEWIPLRDRTGRIVNAKVEQKAAVDYLGVYYGRSLAFDAKHSAGDRIRWDRVEPHQADFLSDWEEDGGISFILVAFRMQHFFAVPWQAWRKGIAAWRRKEGQASISLKKMDPLWEVKATRRSVIDYLATVDNLCLKVS